MLGNDQSVCCKPKACPCQRGNEMLTQEDGAWTTAGCLAPANRGTSLCPTTQQLGTVMAPRPLLWSVSSVGEQGHTGQSCSGVPVQASRCHVAQGREVGRPFKRSQRVSWAGQGRWEGEGADPRRRKRSCKSTATRARGTWPRQRPRKTGESRAIYNLRALWRQAVDA